MIPGDRVYKIFTRRSIPRPHQGLVVIAPSDSEPSNRHAFQAPTLASPRPSEEDTPPPEPFLETPRPSPPEDELATIDRTLIEILARDPHPRETIDAAFRRKEQQVGEVFAGLTPAEARTIQGRLEAGLAADALARNFHRLAADRRQRLLAFLADAPRRIELARKSRP